jgi:hypothetical protein
MNKNPPSSFYIGQKVVCIDDRFSPAVLEWCDHLPIAGCVYTIREMQVAADPSIANGVRNLGFLLDEIVNPSNNRGFEPGFFHTRFIPWLEVCSEVGHTDAVKPLQLQEVQ